MSRQNSSKDVSPARQQWRAVASCSLASKHIASRSLSVLGILLLLALAGCSMVPDARHRDRFHNPLPQLHRIAVLPFFNQSTEPTLDPTRVAEAYYSELQTIPGFEVMPVGVANAMAEEYAFKTGATDPYGSVDWEKINFQELAQAMNVDAIVLGTVTDYSPYYPPRMALTTRWYAANPAFHPVPAGYGLPWGTKAEKEIPRRILLETELEVARVQLRSQTPQVGLDATSPAPIAVHPDTAQPESMESDPRSAPPAEELLPPRADEITAGRGASVVTASGELVDPDFGTEICLDPVEVPLASEEQQVLGPPPAPLPNQWPDPSRLIPAPPNPYGAPLAIPQPEPVLSHTRIYHGDDPDFTEKLADYVYAMDEGRLGGWRGYLTRSDDFIRFCCYLHITEMLEMRGGRDQSDLILRWPIGRYRR